MGRGIHLQRGFCTVGKPGADVGIAILLRLADHVDRAVPKINGRQGARLWGERYHAMRSLKSQLVGGLLPPARPRRRTDSPECSFGCKKAWLGADELIAETGGKGGRVGAGR